MIRRKHSTFKSQETVLKRNKDRGRLNSRQKARNLLYKLDVYVHKKRCFLVSGGIGFCRGRFTYKKLIWVLENARVTL